MYTLNALKSFNGEPLTNYPRLKHNSLFERIRTNLHLELIYQGEKYLLTPFYTLIRGEWFPELKSFIDSNEAFLDSLKEFIINTLFLYSSVIEENAYYISHDQDVIIGRLVFHEGQKFAVKFYSHYQDELVKSYSDKIYLGRIFVDLKKFEKKNFGLNDYFLSVLDQNTKIQERARHKLRFYDEYEKAELKEIDYLCKELTGEALERLKTFPKRTRKAFPPWNC